MAFSGTFNYAPSVGELVLNAYARCRKFGPALTQQHWFDARIESGLMQAEWSNKGVNLWTVDLQSIPLVAGTQTYTVPSNTIAILDVYISTPGAAFGGTNDRFIIGWSRDDFAAQPNKSQQGAPTAWWFNRLIAPTLTFWPVPDSAQSYTANFYRYRMIQDAQIDSGIQPEMPIRWLDATAAGLSHRLARIHAPELETARKADAVEAWRIAATQDVQGTPLRIQPQLHTYFRRGL